VIVIWSILNWDIPKDTVIVFDRIREGIRTIEDLQIYQRL